jgi:rSAM/selenodomain-associated transferase 1
MLCCQGFEVKNYDFTLGRLAYESLRLVQNPGVNTLKKTECNQRVLLFARYPEKGRVKTRLSTHLEQETILSLYRHFVEDILATLQRSGYPFTICYLPSEKGGRMKAWLGAAFAYLPQTGDDLGKRMGNAFTKTFTTSPPRVEQAILLGSDSPDLDPEILDQAFDSLSRNDVTLGPAADGGYYLIGFNRHTFFKEAFTGISWGTGRVLTETLHTIEDAGLRVHILPEWRDIDTFEDLELFYRGANEKRVEHLKTVQYLHTILARNR